jgi:hypothetical protein
VGKTRKLAAALLVVGLLLAAAPVSQAQPGGAVKPPKLDVKAATKALEDQQIYRAPGAVAYFDETRIRAALKPNVRILVAPYTGHFEKGNNYADGDALYDQVSVPLDEWATRAKVRLILVQGLYVYGIGDDVGAYGPYDIPTLRQTTAYLDVTEAVLVLTRQAGGMSQDAAADLKRGSDYVLTDPVPPTEDQLDELAENLREHPVYNAPGRDEDPIDPLVAELAGKAGLPVKVAAFPAPEPGEPVVDYAPALRTLFPNDYVLVAHGRWLDVAGPDDKIVSARDYAYGRFEIGSFEQGSAMSDRMGTVLTRLSELLRKTAFGRPQPAPQPKPQPFDVERAVSTYAPWVLLGSAVLLAAFGLLGWRRKQARQAEKDRLALHLASARAFAKIGDLGVRILTAEEDGGRANPAAAERHATATTLFDQAHTAEAMAEVEQIADEGLALEVRT